MRDENGKAWSEGGQRKGHINPRILWRSRNRSGDAVCRRRRHRIEEQPREDDGRYRCSISFVWIDRFGNQDEDHVPDGETYGQGFSLLGQPAWYTNKPPSLFTLGQLCARTPTLLPKSTGACCWSTYVSDGIVCDHTTNPPHRSGSYYYGCSKLG